MSAFTYYIEEEKTVKGDTLLIKYVISPIQS